MSSYSQDPRPQQPEPSQVARTGMALLLHPRITDQSAPDTITTLVHLTDAAQTAQTFCHGLQFDLSAFNDPLRPAECVAGVRQYLQCVHAQWPFWGHYLMPDSRQWRTLLLAIAPMRPDGRGAFVTNKSALRGHCMQMMFAARTLHKHLKVSEHDSKAILAKTRTAILETGL